MKYVPIFHSKKRKFQVLAKEEVYPKLKRLYRDDYQLFLRDLYAHQRIHGVGMPLWGNKVIIVKNNERRNLDSLRVEALNKSRSDIKTYYMLHTEKYDAVLFGFNKRLKKEGNAAKISVPMPIANARTFDMIFASLAKNNVSDVEITITPA